jgi:hypothetical protein
MTRPPLTALWSTKQAVALILGKPVVGGRDSSWPAGEQPA